MNGESSHQDKVRERFTATADVFAQTMRAVRVEEAERLAGRATDGLTNANQALAIDVACGPGTFTRPLARRVARAIGVDLTPAMVEKARAEAAEDGISNIEFVCADVYSLPVADAPAGIVSCGYAFHHMTEPARALAEMARVLRPGGRVAITDIIVPEGCDASIQNAIERVRDPSHTSTQSVTSFRSFIRDLGLSVISENLHENWHDFDAWMRNAGKPPGDPVYVQVRRMMESRVGEDSGGKAGGPPSGFHPRLSNATPSGLQFMHTVLQMIAGKPE